MAQGSGSAKALVVTALLCLVQFHNIAESAVYTVGDKRGWTFNINRWTEGKRFRAGDVLVFNYDQFIHDVVVVDAAGYKACRIPAGSKVLSSGSDRVTLSKGHNYFMCTLPGHCESGLKLAVKAV